MPEKNMTTVFISYSRKDKLFAEKLDSALEAVNLDAWIDWDDIPPTADWWVQIQKGIESADAFLFLLSPDSIKSEVCRDEIDHAVKNGKRLIPLVVHEVDPVDVHPALTKLNWIFFRGQDDFTESLKKLEGGIHTDLEWVEAHTRLQVRAVEWERRGERSLLLRGIDLREAEEQLTIAGQKDPLPTDLQRRYVLESRKRESRTRNLLLIVSAIVVVVLTIASLIAVRQSNYAVEQANTAVAANSTAVMEANFRATAQANAEEQARIALSNGLSSNALLLHEKNELSLAFLLSVQANQFAETTRSKNALFTLLEQNKYLHAVLPVPETLVENFPSFRTNSTGDLLLADMYDSGKPFLTDVEYVLWDLRTYQLLDNEIFPLDNQISVNANTRRLMSDDTGLALDGSIEIDRSIIPSYKIGSLGASLDVILLPDSRTAIAWFCKFSKAMVGRCTKLSVLVLGRVGRDVPYFTPQVISLPESALNFLAIAFDQKDQLFALADVGGGTVQLWQEVEGDLHLVKSFGLPGFVSLRDSRGFEFNPDRQIIAWGSEDNKITIWDMSINAVAQEYQFDFSFNDFVLNPDASMLAIQSELGTQVFVRDGSRFQSVETGIDPNISGVLSFDENTQILAIGTGTHIWTFDTSTWVQVSEIEITSTSETRIASMFINKDATTIAVGMSPAQAGPPARTYLIDIQTGLETGPFDEIVTPILSSDNYTLASMSFPSNDSIYLWHLDVDAWKAQACKIANRNLTESEWGQYMGSEPYQRTCPNFPSPN